MSANKNRFTVLNDKIIAEKQKQSSVKKVLLKISQNSQENICARVSFLINLQYQVYFLVSFL